LKKKKPAKIRKIIKNNFVGLPTYSVCERFLCSRNRNSNKFLAMGNIVSHSLSKHPAEVKERNMWCYWYELGYLNINF